MIDESVRDLAKGCGYLSLAILAFAAIAAGIGLFFGIIWKCFSWVTS